MKNVLIVSITTTVLLFLLALVPQYFIFRQQSELTHSVQTLANQLQDVHVRMGTSGCSDVSVTPIGSAGSSVVTWEALQKQLQDTVVQIFTQFQEFNWAEPYRIPRISGCTGSGFFIDEQGFIATNAHVVNEATAISIQIPTFGKMQFDVDLVGIMPEKDIALLKLKDADREMIIQKLGYFPVISLGDSDTIRRSADVMALGYPLGQQSLKSTTGIISGRESGLIQMSAAINPGNSGGPLVNTRGEVIGINSAGIMAAQNVGYMIPINDFKAYLDDLKRGGLVRKPYLGILQAPSTEDLAICLGNPKPGGIYIAEVLQDSPLHEKLQPGDMVYEVNGHAIDIYGEMTVPWSEDKISIAEYVGRLSVGQKVTLLVYRKGQKLSLECNFERRTLAPIRQVYPMYEPIDYEVFGGLVVMQLSLNHLAVLGITSPGLAKFAEPRCHYEPILIITKVIPDSIAYRARVPFTGTIIDKVNDVEVGTLEQLRDAIAKSKDMIVIENGDHAVAAFDVQKVLDSEPRLAQLHGYKIGEGLRRLQAHQKVKK